MREPDQSLEALQACYDFTGEPKAVRADLHASESLEARVLIYGRAARRRIFMRALAAELLSASDADVESRAGIVEYAWFLYGRKDWPRLARFLDRNARPGLPPHLADLRFLSCLRLEAPRIRAGGPAGAFREAVEAVLAEIEALWPGERARLSAYRLLTEHMTGAFGKARDGLVERFDALRFIEPLSGLQSIVTPTEEAPGPGTSLRRLSERSAVTLLSVDEAYFRRFGETFIEAHRRLRPERGLHLHCVGFEPEAPDGIGVTVDRTDLSGFGDAQRRGYYACARYLHLPDHLDRYEDVLVTDVDGLPSATPDLSRAAVLLSTRVLEPGRELHRLPWECVSAHGFRVDASPEGRRFALGLARYLATVLRRARGGMPFWFADQNALFYTWLQEAGSDGVAAFDRAPFTQAQVWRQFEGDGEKRRFIAGAQRLRTT